LVVEQEGPRVTPPATGSIGKQASRRAAGVN